MKEEFLFIKAKNKLHKINPIDILYIEAMDDYVNINLKNNTLKARMTMKLLLHKLDSDQFIRVHRSFIVPVKSIEAVGTKNIVVNGTEIALGKNYSEEVLKVFKKEA